MINRFRLLPIAVAAILSLVSTALGQDTTDASRTADQVKAMLAKAVAAVKADKAKRWICSTKGKAASGTAI